MFSQLKQNKPIIWALSQKAQLIKSLTQTYIQIVFCFTLYHLYNNPFVKVNNILLKPIEFPVY